LYGRKPELPLLPSLDIQDPKTYDTETWMSFLNEKIPLIHHKALENIKKAQEYQKKFYDKKS
ncbi:uncharacterized protein EV154DRAFT_388911, partial [Mucor mucedo]|uniref:uncharacterized protein n=1 Tax=Mucor mucedo TaxID=29922 RepID=UPI002220E3C6